MRTISSVFAVMAVIACCSCGGGTKPNPESRTYENAYNSSSTATDTEADNPYLENKLQTGSIPYDNGTCNGEGSTISVRTSANSECDVVVIVKKNSQIVRNVYIEAGDSYELSVPNGTYQVFFYGGKGWNPQKKMAGGNVGGFVANESYSKDSPVSLNYQGVSYELIPQQNGNFSTKQSNAAEIFK